MKHNEFQRFDFGHIFTGLNTRDKYSNQDVNSSSDLCNVEHNPSGGIRERRGYRRLNVTPTNESTFLGLHDFKPSGGSQQLVCVIDDAIYKMDTLDGTMDNITGTVALTSASTNYVNFAVGLDTLIGTNGVDAPWKYTQTGSAADLIISEFTISKFVKFFHQRLIHFVTTEGGDLKNTRVRWSDSNTIETYTAANYLDLNTSDGAGIIGVESLYGDIYVFKNSFTNGILRFYYTGNDIVTFSYDPLNEVGAASNGSIVKISTPELGAGIVYWGLDNKIRFFNGNVSIPISDKIQPTLDGLNSNRMQYIQAVNNGVKDQIEFYVSNGSSSTHNMVIVYDYKYRTFLVHNNIDANIGCIAIDSTNEAVLVNGGTNGLLYKRNIGSNDDGSALKSYCWGAWQDFGDSTIAKSVRWAKLFLSDLGNYDITVQWGFNFSDSAFSSKDINLASGDETFPFTFPFILGGITVKRKQIEMQHTGVADYFRIGFKNDNADEPWTVHKYSLFVKGLGIKE